MDWNDLLSKGFYAYAGSVITILYGRWASRTSVIEYKISNLRVGVSVNDAVFGNTEVLHAGNRVGSVTYTTLRAKNSTRKDFSNFRLKVFSDPKNYFANVQGVKNGSLTVFSFSAKCSQDIAKSGAIFCVEYEIPVFNRNEEIEFRVLAVNPHGEAMALAWLSLDEPGMQLKMTSNVEQFWGTPRNTSAIVGLVLTGLLLIPISFYSNSHGWPNWSVNLLAWLAGSFCLVPGAIAIRAFRRVRQIF